MCLARVVLPDPFWPIIATKSPGIDRQIDAVQGTHGAAAVFVSQVPGFDQWRSRSRQGSFLAQGPRRNAKQWSDGSWMRPADERLGFVDIAGMRRDAQAPPARG